MKLLQKGVEAMLFLLGAIFAVLLVGEIVDPDYVLRAWCRCSPAKPAGAWLRIVAS
jgi:hypothetical protein